MQATHALNKNFNLILVDPIYQIQIVNSVGNHNRISQIRFSFTSQLNLLKIDRNDKYTNALTSNFNDDTMHLYTTCPPATTYLTISQSKSLDSNCNLRFVSYGIAITTKSS